MGTVLYNTVSRALVTFAEDAGTALVTSTTFKQPLPSAVLNRFTFQFTGGGGGGPTMAIEVQGATGEWSPYTNSSGTAATGIAAATAYIVDTGSWMGFRVTWTGSNGSAVLSVLGWNDSADIATLEARIAELETDRIDLDAINGYRATVQQEIIGSVVGLVETAFNAADAFLTWPADIEAGNEIMIEAIVENTGTSGATFWAARLYWGGKASGVQVNTSTGLGTGVGRIQRIRTVVTYDAVGAIPSWQFAGEIQDNVSGANTITAAGFGKTTQPTTAGILIEATGQFTGGVPAAGDKLKLRKLTARKLAPQVEP